MPVKIARAPMPHVFRRYPVRLDHRRLQLIPPQEPCEERSSPDISAARGVPHHFGSVGGLGPTACGSGGRHSMPGVRPIQGVTLESGIRDVSGSTGAKRDDDQLELGTYGPSRQRPRIPHSRPEQLELLGVHLHGVEAAKPGSPRRQLLRDAQTAPSDTQEKRM